MRTFLMLLVIVFLGSWAIVSRLITRSPKSRTPVSSEQQLRAEIADLKQQLAAKSIGRKIGQIEFTFAHRTFLMDEYVIDGSESDWPSVACVSTIGDRKHRNDRSLQFGDVRIFPITTLDLEK